MKKRPDPKKTNPSADTQGNASTNQSDLFGSEPSFQAIWPTSPDEVEVLRRLLAGERLTQPKYGFDDWRLGARIKALKYKHFPIESLRINHQRSKYPYKQSKIAEYFIAPDNLFKLRELIPPALSARIES